MIDQAKYDVLTQWIGQNVGKRFKIIEDNEFTTYSDSEGKLRKMNTAPFKDRAVFLEYMKYYCEMENYISSKLPQVEFSDDYSTFKIYFNGKNFYIWS